MIDREPTLEMLLLLQQILVLERLLVDVARILFVVKEEKHFFFG